MSHDFERNFQQPMEKMMNHLKDQGALPGCEDLPRNANGLKNIRFDSFEDAKNEYQPPTKMPGWKFTVEIEVDHQGLIDMDDENILDSLRCFGKIRIIAVDEIGGDE